jgi:hypothetical protein
LSWSFFTTAKPRYAVLQAMIRQPILTLIQAKQNEFAARPWDSQTGMPLCAFSVMPFQRLTPAFLACATKASWRPMN